MAVAVRVRLLLLLIFILVAQIFAAAQMQVSDDVSTRIGTQAREVVPRMVRFSALLMDGSGRPVVGTVPVVFSIYAQQQDEKPLWTETQIVTTDAGGVFTVSLGASSSSGLPLDEFQANHARWLGFHAEGQLEQTRVLLLSAPYALKAADSESLNGLPASAFIQWKDLQASSFASVQPSTSAPTKTSATFSPETATSTTITGFIPEFLDTATFVQSPFFDAGGKVGLNTQTPVAVLHVAGDGTAELAQLEATADANTGLAILNTKQAWELALRQDMQEALVVRNKTANTDVMQIAPTGDVSISGKLGIGTATPGAQLDVAGDLKISSAGGGIVFPDGTRQTTASQVEVEVGSSPDTVVERDSTGSIAVTDANLHGNLRVPVNGYIATSDAVDSNVGAVPKLFLSAAGGPGGGVIPSLTFRSLNPSHIYGELAFQDNTPSPGQDIWALAQDLFFTHTENLGFRRRGQSVMTFWPLSAIGSDVLTVFTGSRFRLERSGPYPFEYRDLSFPLPNGLWRTAISQDCWLLDKNTALAGDFSNHIPVIQTCADLNLVLAAGMSLNGPISASGNFSVTTPRDVTFASTGTGNIRFNPGAGGFTFFGGPVGIGTNPAGSMHVLSGGNFQDGIFAAFQNANEGISIRNTAQNWAMGIRADRNQEFDVRNITAGFDAVEISNSGDVTVGHGQLNPTQGIAVGKSVSNDGSGLKHGRAPIIAVGKGATSIVELDWKTPFADANYTVNCSVVSSPATTAALHLHHIDLVSANKVVAVITNDDSANSQSGVLNCMAMHD